ncbi:MAG TPA: ion channel [Gemmatimonadales bacterium]|nr:ion channel [Gemmatimonadales bacterium]
MAVTREPPEDLGFGSVVAREAKSRLLNKDGSFNVRREGLPYWRSHSLYRDLLTISWPHFLLLVCGAFLALNAIFALLYLASGPGALVNASGAPVSGFGRAFFFSVHTLATIGYGNVTPGSLVANLLVTLEALVGLLVFALAAGLAFARVSRPTAAILFSDVAVIAPYRGGEAFMFRIVNGRKSEIVELDAQVVLTRRRAGGGSREFHALTLERRRVAFFPLSWTVVHPIDDQSPLKDATAEGLRSSDSEFLVLLAGTDDTFTQTVHARTSYRAGEVVCGARFLDMFRHDGRGVPTVDISRLSAIEKVAMD